MTYLKHLTHIVLVFTHFFPCYMLLFVHHSFLSQHFPTKIHIKMKAYPLKKEAMNIIIVILVLGNWCKEVGPVVQSIAIVIYHYIERSQIRGAKFWTIRGKKFSDIAGMKWNGIHNLRFRIFITCSNRYSCFPII